MSSTSSLSADDFLASKTGNDVRRSSDADRQTPSSGIEMKIEDDPELQEEHVGVENITITCRGKTFDMFQISLLHYF